MSGLGVQREVSLSHMIRLFEARLATLEAKVKTLETAGPVYIYPSLGSPPQSLWARVFGRKA